MPWPVYSERLLYTETPGAWWSIEVPAGKRMIVSAIAACRATNAVGQVSVKAHGILVVNQLFPADVYQLNLAVRLTLYERETLQTYLNGTGLSMMANGYLFDDPVGQSDALAGAYEDATEPPPFALVG